MDGRAAAAPRIDLLVVGHTNVDRLYEVPRLPERDRTVAAAHSEIALGGPAANLARAAAARGLRCALVSRVGPDFPPDYGRALRAAGVRTEGLEIVEGRRTPSCVILEDGHGGQTTVIDQGAMSDARGAHLRGDLIASSRWIHLGTGPPELLLAILREARRAGRPVSADPAQEVHYRWKRAPLLELLHGSEIAFGNRAELSAMARLVGARGMRALLDHVPLLVGTDGSAGAFAESRAGRIAVRGEPVTGVRRVTGAGDAFRAGFYPAWLSGEPLDRCLSEGNRAAVDRLSGRTLAAPRRRRR